MAMFRRRRRLLIVVVIFIVFLFSSALSSSSLQEEEEEEEEEEEKDRDILDALREETHAFLDFLDKAREEEDDEDSAFSAPILPSELHLQYSDPLPPERRTLQDIAVKSDDNTDLDLVVVNKNYPENDDDDDEDDDDDGDDDDNDDDDEDTKALRKRQFSSVLSGGYKLGKRNPYHSDKETQSLNFNANPEYFHPKTFGYFQPMEYKLEYDPEKNVDDVANGLAMKEKRLFGNVLGGGYKVGKRGKNGEINHPDVLIDSEEKRQFGQVLGGGFKIGKRQDMAVNYPELDEDKRQFGGVLGSGYKLGKREYTHDDNPDVFKDETKRQFGSVLGQGYKVGKRQNMAVDYPEFLINEGKRQFGSVLGSGYKLGKREKTNINNPDGKMNERKRKFGNVLGRGYKVGKKRDMTVRFPAQQVYEEIKRELGQVLGGGYKIGKREDIGSDNPDIYEDKRQYGRVLGGGYKIGKRQHGILKDKRQFGRVLAGGYKTGKRETMEKGHQNPYIYPTEHRQEEKRQFGQVLGGGYKIGKRENTLVNNVDWQEGKRHLGSVLGGGFKLGKREMSVSNPYMYVDKIKRPFGQVLNKGDKVGKRPAMKYSPGMFKDKRQFGGVLSGGYKLGKREHMEENHVIENKRQFGRVLNGGFKIGKREDESSTAKTDKREYGSVLRGGYKLGKRKISMVSFPDMINDFHENEFSKRQFGRILGQGFKIGKKNVNTNSNLEDTDVGVMSRKRKRQLFSRVLSGGYKMGKRERSGHDEFDTKSTQWYPPETPSERRYSGMPVESPSPAWDQNAEPHDHNAEENGQSSFTGYWNPNSVPAAHFPAENENSMPVIPFSGYPNSESGGPFPEEHQSSTPADPFPAESHREWNRDSTPYSPSFAPEQWDQSKSPPGTIPADMSFSKTVVLKQSVSFPRSNIAASQFFFDSSPAYIHDEQQLSDPEHELSPQTVSWMINALLEKAQSLLQHLASSPLPENVPSVYQPDAIPNANPSADEGPFLDIKRSSVVAEPMVSFLKVQNSVENQVSKGMFNRNEDSSEMASMNNRFFPHTETLLKNIGEQSGGKAGTVGIVSKRRSSFHPQMVNPSKRWFFDIVFPRGFKLGKRTEDHHTKAEHSVRKSRSLDEQKLETVKSLVKYVEQLQQNLQHTNRFTRKNSNNHRTKRDVDFTQSMNPVRENLCKLLSFLVKNTTEGNPYPCGKSARQLISSFVISLSTLLASMLQVNRLHFLQTKNFNPFKFDKHDQASVHRSAAIQNLQRIAASQSGSPWQFEQLNPYGYFYLRKRNIFPDNAASLKDQSSVEASASKEMGQRLDTVNKLSKSLNTGQHLENGSEEDDRKQIRKFYTTEPPVSAQSMFTGVEKPHSNPAKRFFRKVLGGFKVGGKEAPSANKRRMKRSVLMESIASQNTHNQKSRTQGDGDMMDRNKRIIWRFFKPTTERSLPAAKAHKLILMAKRSNLEKIRKILDIFAHKVLAMNSDEKPSEEELRWLTETLKHRMRLYLKGDHFDSKLLTFQKKQSTESADRENPEEKENTVKRLWIDVWENYKARKPNLLSLNKNTGTESSEKNHPNQGSVGNKSSKENIAMVSLNKNKATKENVRSKLRKHFLRFITKGRLQKLSGQLVFNLLGKKTTNDENYPKKSSGLQDAVPKRVLSSEYKPENNPFTDKVPTSLLPQTNKNDFPSDNSELQKQQLLEVLGFQSQEKHPRMPTSNHGAKRSTESLDPKPDEEMRELNIHSMRVPSAQVNSEPRKTFDWGNNVTQFWNQLAQDANEPRQSVLSGNDGPFPSKVHMDISSLSPLDPDLWENLADFLFGGHEDDGLGNLVDFLDPTSFTPTPNIIGNTMIQPSPQT